MMSKWITLLFLTTSFWAFSQDVQYNSTDIGVSYGFFLPGADLADRYGNNLMPQFSVNLYRAKQGLQLGIKAGIITGVEVKVPIFEPFLNVGGVLISDNGFPGDISTSQRGLILGAIVNKNVISFKNNNSFIFAGLGLGVLQHKIRITINDAFVPQYLGDYKKGYDRNSRGPYLEEVIGWKLRKKRLNLDIDFEFIQGYTKSLRALNFDTQMSDTDRRLDLLFGMKITYYLSLITAIGSEDIFY